MFEISWSELLILGLVTLIFVGPKELPRFLGTLGRYAGVVRRHANEFRAVFEQAVREAEMDEIQKEVRAMSDGVKASLDDATRHVERAKAAATVEPSIAKPAAETKPAAVPAVSSTEPAVAELPKAADSKAEPPIAGAGSETAAPASQSEPERT
jgi:sec-independent protein translocase protein TatB